MTSWLSHQRYTRCLNCGMGSEDEAVEVVMEGYSDCHYCGATHYMEWGNKIELVEGEDDES